MYSNVYNVTFILPYIYLSGFIFGFIFGKMTSIAIPIIVILLLIYCTCGRDSVQFISRSDLASFIINDHDGYIRTLSQKDLRDRKCKTQSEYKEMYLNNIMEFSPLQKERLKEYARQASEFLRTVRSPFIDNRIISGIPWKFARTSMILEKGHPHTRKDVIFLPKNSLDRPRINIVRTLVHEKIHVYQKMHSKKFVHSLLHNGYTVVGRLDNEKRISNPDTDGLIYRHPSGRIMMWDSDSKDPMDALYEHPNELIAYKVAQQYFAQAKNDLKAQGES